MTRQLVITADDLGVDPDTNATIVELLAEGSISASTLITVAPAAEDAARRVLDAGVVSPHLHVTLTSSRGFDPWRPHGTHVPSLTDHRGHFHLQAGLLGRHGEPAHVQHEIGAQLRWMHDAGLRPRAIDSHSGTLYGFRGRSFLHTAIDVSADHGLGFRMPRRSDGRGVGLALRGPLRTRHGHAVALAEARGVGLPETITTCWLPGRLILSYAQLRAHYLSQLRALPEGTSEMFLHPTPERSARQYPGPDGRKRVWELRLLRDPVFTRELERQDIRIVPAWSGPADRRSG